MHIHIDKGVANDKDRTIIKLLEVCPTFIKEVDRIRKKFKVDNYTYFNTRKFLNSYKGKFATLALCTQEKQDKLLSNNQFHNDVSKLCKRFNLDSRWNLPMSYIILFSYVVDLPSGILCRVEKNISENDIIGIPSILIRVTSDISKERMINWVRGNWDKLRRDSDTKEVIKKQKGVPIIDYLKFDRDLIRLHEGKHMSAHQISLHLMEKYEKDKTHWDLAINEQLIEQRIKRYRKLFGIK